MLDRPTCADLIMAHHSNQHIAHAGAGEDLRDVMEVAAGFDLPLDLGHHAASKHLLFVRTHAIETAQGSMFISDEPPFAEMFSREPVWNAVRMASRRARLSFDSAQSAKDLPRLRRQRLIIGDGAYLAIDGALEIAEIMLRLQSVNLLDQVAARHIGLPPAFSTGPNGGGFGLNCAGPLQGSPVPRLEKTVHRRGEPVGRGRPITGPHAKCVAAHDV